MKKKTRGDRFKSVVLVAAIQILLIVLPVAAREIPVQLPDPDGKPAAMVELLSRSNTPTLEN